jgi:hypothetical protein
MLILKFRELKGDIMSKDRLKELKEELKLAKEANTLTAENINTIVHDAVAKIIKELEFDRDMTADAIKDVLDTTRSSLDEFGELTTQNIKAGSEGIQKALKDEMDFHSKKFKELHQVLAEESEKDMKIALDEAKQSLHHVKAFGELSLDVFHHALEGAINGAKKALDEKKSKNHD